MYLHLRHNICLMKIRVIQAIVERLLKVLFQHNSKLFLYRYVTLPEMFRYHKIE